MIDLLIWSLLSLGRLAVGSRSEIALYQLSVQHDLPSWALQWRTKYNLGVSTRLLVSDLFSQSVRPLASGLFTFGLPTRPSYSTTERSDLTRKHRPANPNPPAPAPPHSYNLAHNTFQQRREHPPDHDCRPRAAHLLSCPRRSSSSTTPRHCRSVCLLALLDCVELGFTGLLDEPSGNEERMW